MTPQVKSVRSGLSQNIRLHLELAETLSARNLVGDPPRAVRECNGALTIYKELGASIPLSAVERDRQLRAQNLLNTIAANQPALSALR